MKIEPFLHCLQPCSCKKNPPAFTPSSSVYKTIFEAKKREEDRLHPIRALPKVLFAGIIAGSISWYQNDSSVLSFYVAITTLRFTVEGIIQILKPITATLSSQKKIF